MFVDNHRVDEDHFAAVAEAEGGIADQLNLHEVGPGGWLVGWLVGWLEM